MPPTMPRDPGSESGSQDEADRRSAVGLSKEEVRRIVIDKLRVVYRDWHFAEVPFADFLSEAGERREDPRAFVIALVAALLGGISDAIEQNNEAVAAALVRHRRARPRARNPSP
jgi:hypothetical protein